MIVDNWRMPQTCSNFQYLLGSPSIKKHLNSFTCKITILHNVVQDLSCNQSTFRIILLSPNRQAASLGSFLLSLPAPGEHQILQSIVYRMWCAPSRTKSTLQCFKPTSWTHITRALALVSTWRFTVPLAMVGSYAFLWWAFLLVAYTWLSSWHEKQNTELRTLHSEYGPGITCWSLWRMEQLLATHEYITVLKLKYIQFH